jgi:hypothetical protein
VVLREHLDQSARPLEVGDEVLDRVEEALRLAQTADSRLERDDARLLLVGDLLPVAEPLPRRERRPDLRLRTRREDDKAIGREQLRDRVAIVGEVLVVGLLRRLVRCLELQQHERDAVDEADDVRPPRVQRAGDPELRDRKEVVRQRIAPIDEADGLGLPPALVVGERDLRAIAQQLPDGLACADPIHRRAVEHELLDRLVERARREIGVELRELGP